MVIFLCAIILALLGLRFFPIPAATQNVRVSENYYMLLDDEVGISDDNISSYSIYSRRAIFELRELTERELKLCVDSVYSLISESEVKSVEISKSMDSLTVVINFSELWYSAKD